MMNEEVRIIDGQPAIRHTGTLVGVREQMQVWLWDCGPEEPVLPTAPEPPSGKDGDPKYDLAKIGYKRQLRTYEAALEQYERDEAEYKRWQRDKGGPVEIIMWSVDARDALSNDARQVKSEKNPDGRQTRARYCLSSRTKGYGHLKNGGLPKGMKPGHGQEANVERQIAGEKEFLAALKADPVFGQEIQR